MKQPYLLGYEDANSFFWAKCLTPQPTSNGIADTFSPVLAEVENWVASVESGIDLLVKRGMADRDNVGIIGECSSTPYRFDGFLLAC